MSSAGPVVPNPEPPDEARIDQALIDQVQFRATIARMASGVCVVASRLHDRDHAMTATSFMSLSLDPLLVAIGVGSDSRMLDAIAASKVFSVSVLSDQQRAIADWLATPGRPVVNQLARVTHRRGRFGAILIDDAVAAFECRLFRSHEVGDHMLVIGQVQALELGPVSAEPLIWVDGGYRSLRP